MTGEKIFQKYYEPKLIKQEIANVVLRTYIHIKGSTGDMANYGEVIFTPRNEVDKRLNDLFAKTGTQKGISITSLVSHKHTQKYLFLLDYSLSVSKKNETELIRVLTNSTGILPALKKGMILKTKNSYHVVGFIPLEKDVWHKHMAEAILLRTSKGEDISDIRYIGHSLERGYGCLRVSDYEDKPTPDFVCYI